MSTKKREKFLELAHQFAAESDRRKAEQLKKELARLTFGGTRPKKRKAPRK